MIEISVECPHCCAPLEVSEDKKSMICLYCDSEFPIEERLPKEIEHVKNICYKNQLLDDVLLAGDLFEKMPNYEFILKNFEVDKDDEVFLFCDTSLWSNGSKGFMICKSGIYYRADKKRYGKYTWEDFKVVSIKSIPQWGDIVIDELSYSIGEKYCVIIERILKEIKELVMNIPTESDTLMCLHCGAELVLDANKVTAECLYCNKKYLLTENELEKVRENTINLQPMKMDYIYKISEICANHKPVDEFQEFLKLSRSMKKSWVHKRALKKAQKKFGVPAEDDCFMIFDATAVGTLAMGFAVCTSGLYYCESNKKKTGSLSWKEFRNAKIVLDKDRILIGDIYFDAFTEKRELMELRELLNKIQACL